MFWGHSLSVCMFVSSQFCVLRSLFVCRCRKCFWERKTQNQKKIIFALQHYFCHYCNAGKCTCKYSSWLNWMLMWSYNFMHFSNADLWLNVLNLHANNASMQKTKQILFIFFMQNMISYFLCWFWADIWGFVFLYVTHTRVLDWLYHRVTSIAVNGS